MSETTTDTCGTGRMTVNMLPDDALLAIFDFYQADAMHREPKLWRWHILVHVCRRWRRIVFSSPHRLHLQLFCKPSTPASASLDIWPPLPINIHYWSTHEEGQRGEENITAALECRDRVSEISFDELPSCVLERFAAAMEEPFQTLTFLRLESFEETTAVLPDTFLGGSAPRLRSFALDGIAFPALPNLLLSANHLRGLWLWRIPNTGYISPEAMVTCLVALTSLKTLFIEFQSPRSRPVRRRLPPLTRVVLPALTQFSFRGVSEYLEDLVARIDVPQLSSLNVTFFNQLLFDVPQFHQFVGRIETLTSFTQAEVKFYGWVVKIILGSPDRHGKLELGIRCKTSDWQVSSIAQVCSQQTRLFSQVEQLSIREIPWAPPVWQDDMDPTQWLELFYPFTSVQSLYLPKKLGPRVMPALQELNGERAPQVLPTLHSLFLEELHPSESEPANFKGIIEALRVAPARQLSNHRIDIRHWEQDSI